MNYKLSILTSIRIPKRPSKALRSCISDAVTAISNNKTYWSRSGLTATLLVEKLQELGIPFRVELTKFGILVGPLTEDKWDFVAKLPKEGGRIGFSEIKNWLNEKLKSADVQQSIEEEKQKNRAFTENVNDLIYEDSFAGTKRPAQ